MNRTRPFTLLAAGAVIVGMGLTAGCAAPKESPSPTGKTTTSMVDSKTNVKRPGTGDN
jgi:PBP1b-binding outer membrane lipoprotein LpoB